jgi:hypothetical protein
MVDGDVLAVMFQVDGVRFLSLGCRLVAFLVVMLALVVMGVCEVG